MIKNIVKRNGKTEKFDAAKVNGWGEFAQDKFGGAIQWNGIVLDAVSSLPETCSSEDLQKALINGCANKATWEYNIMAGRLYSALTLKQLYGKTRPTLHALHKRMIADGSLVEMGYTDEEYKQLNKALDHKIELTYPHYRIKQIRERYALTKKLKNGGKIEYESSQFSYMRVAMAQMVNRPRETRVQDVIKLYGHLAAGRINVPTPFFKNSGTKLNAYTSCCTYNTDDNLKSLNAGDAIAYFMTAASAGIGCNIGSRSLGDLVRDGEIVHQGKIPYYRLLAELVKANIQSGRGGSATTFFSAFDPQVESLLMLMNPLTPKARQLRDIDYAFMSNGFFVDAVKNGSQIGLFSIHDAPDLYEAQFDKNTELFGKLYHEHMAKGTPFKLVNARDIAVQFMTQSVETGRIYQTFTDHLNTHTPFKDKIRTSNLCLEIALPTEGYESVLDLYNADAEKGEVGLCTIGGLNAAEIEDDDQYAECAYYSLLMIDNAINNSSYEFPHVAMTARKRMNAAVGLVGVAHWLAKQHLNYTTQKGRDAMYELGETHYWHLVNASLKISKERGVAEWMHKTKWIDGWLPIDTYCKEIDNIVTVGRKRDWEGLRKQIIANGGIGHSVLCAHMPAETSSVATGSTNGLYPIRDFTLMKSTNDEANFYVVPDSTELRWFYDIAWDVPAEDLIKCYGIFQAWTDQAISADLYSKVEADEKISARELLKIYLLCYKYGLKTRYYFNTRTGKDVFNMSETDGCGSGGCKL